MNRRRLAVLGLIVLLAVSMVGPIAAQDAGGNESEYTLDELRQDGKHYSVPSARIVPDEQRVYWLEHTPANQPWSDVSAENNGPKFESGSLLQTNTVYLRTIRAQSDSETVNVTVVTWDPATREVQQGNTTTTERYAANVTSQTKQIELGAGWAVGEVDIPNHDNRKHVTMWIEGHEDTARWTFEHESVAFTTPIDVDNYAEFVLLSGLFVIVPALGTGVFGTRKVRDWIDRAGAPPGHGALYYSILAAVATAGIVMFIYAFAAEIIVSAPIILGVGVGVVYIGFMLATHEGQTDHKLFWQPHIESVDAFAKTKIPSIGSGTAEDSLAFSEDMPFGQMVSFRVLDEGKDGLSIVQDGWLAFLARLKGGRAVIENANELKTRLSLWNSAWDELFIVDPEAETIIEYERPGLSLKTPEINSWHDLVWPGLWIAAGGGIAWQFAQIYGAVAWAGMAVAVPYLIWKFAVKGTDSYVHIDPAPVAMRPVLASMFVLHMGNHKAHKLDEAEEFGWRALAGLEQEDIMKDRRQAETIATEAMSSSNDIEEQLEGAEEESNLALEEIDSIEEDVGDFVQDGEVESDD